MSGSVLFSAEGPVGLITLNRPERRNALTFEMRAELTRGLDDFAVNAEIAVAVVEAAGPLLVVPPVTCRAATDPMTTRSAAASGANRSRVLLRVISDLPFLSVHRARCAT